MNRRRAILAGVIGGIVLITGLWFVFRDSDTAIVPTANAVELPVYDDSAYNTRAPANTRIKVEVLNATTVRGLAREATRYLRDRGFDVVASGNATEKLDSTVILDRSNHPDFAAVVARAMKGRAEARPDTSRYLDVTVLVGRDWRPPAEPFYP